MKAKTLLFLQLPQLDNEVAGPHENLPMAAAYLRRALERAEERPCFAPCLLDDSERGLDDAHLVDAIVARKPSVIACTVYLWNVERTLHVLRQVRMRIPEVKILAGGPEAAIDHPFLATSSLLDGISVGEGEPVFPGLLRALKTGACPDYDGVAWRGESGSLAWGTRRPPSVALQAALPPVGFRWLQPNAQGMAYMEASRGCPLLCTYCRYHHFRRGLSFLPPREVVRRISMGATGG